MLEPREAVPRERLLVSTVRTPEELAALAGEWTQLHERARLALPFALPEWLATWWETFRQDHRLIRDSLHIKVVRHGSGELAGVIPLMLTERPSFGPLRVRALSFLGADEYITEQRVALVDPNSEAEVARALAAHLFAEDTWDWIMWEGLDPKSAFATTLQAVMPLRWGHTETGNVLHLPPTWAEFKTGLKRNIKESLRRCYNSLKRDGLTPRLVVAETAEDVQKGLDRFFALHAMRADQTDGIAHRNRFEGERAQTFLRTVCARLSKRGVPRVFTLHIGDAVVACRIGFMLPDCLYLYYSGFDPAWGKYSVMTTTVAEAINYAIDQGLPRVHLSMGMDVAKARWGPETPAFTQALSVRANLYSRSAAKLYTWAQEHREVVHNLAGILPKRRFD